MSKKKGGTGVDYSIVRYLIQKISGTYGKANVKLFDANVESVDVKSRTCIVNAIDCSLDGLTVRFMIDVSDGDMSVPQVNSTVTVAMTDFTDPYIVKSTWLDEKLFVVGNQGFDIKNDNQIFNDGKFGGLMKVKDPDDSNAGCLKRMNLLEDRINLMTEKWNDFCDNYVPGSPSVTGMPATLIPSKILPNLEKTTETQLVNPNIIHGDKLS